MSFASRYNRQREPLPPLIPEAEVWSRVCAAVRSIDAQGGVLPAGVKSNWPDEFEHVAVAIKWAVWRGNPLKDKLYRKLTVRDFADIWFGETEGSPLPERKAPTAKAISDMLTAGAWYSALQRLRENVEETEARHELYRRGGAPNGLITDQLIVLWYALGFTTKAIASHGEIDLDEHQVSRRLNEISRNLFRIANRIAPLIDLEERQRTRNLTAERDAERRARA